MKEMTKEERDIHDRIDAGIDLIVVLTTIGLLMLCLVLMY
jgi:hypothetical protein